MSQARKDNLPAESKLLVQIMKVPFCISTPLSRRIAASYNIIEDSLTPRCGFHGFIKIKNFTFEYGPQGLAKNEVPYVGPPNQEVHREGTTRTLPEIYQWFYSAETREKFGADKYNLSSNNCLVFVKRMCDFLKIQYPIVFHEILTCLEAVENANKKTAIWNWTGYGMLLVSYGLIQMGSNASESPYTLRNFGVNCFVPMLGTAAFAIHHWVTRNPIFLVLLFALFVFYTYPVIFLN